MESRLNFKANTVFKKSIAAKKVKMSCDIQSLNIFYSLAKKKSCMPFIPFYGLPMPVHCYVLLCNTLFKESIKMFH